MGEREEQLGFLRELSKVDCGHFVYQEENFLKSPVRSLIQSMLVEKGYFKDRFKEYEEKGDPIQGMDLGQVKHLSRGTLEQITDNFSQNNFVRRTLSRRLFRGVIKQDSETRVVMVKTLDFFFPITRHSARNAEALADELLLLTDQDIASHPSLVKLIGYCCQKKLALVYDFNLRRTLQDLIPSDEFSCNQRIKVAIDIAEALEHLHTKQIALGTVCPLHVSVDEEFNIKLFDFDSHLNLQNKNDTIDHLFYAMDARCDSPEIRESYWTPWGKEHAFPSDVYAYGILLMELITKKIGKNLTDFVGLVEKECYNRCSPLEQAFLDVAMRCVQHQFECRPNMNEVVAALTDAVKE